jgi:dihydrofolate synthase/folylpolyglutamate synthase
MNYEAALQRLYKLNRFHRFKYNLDEVRRLAQLYGNPQNQLSFVHVTGTNGKGSVTFKTAKVLEANGLKTGLFVSPHLTTFRERIQVDGKLVEKDFVTDFLNSAFRKIDNGDSHASFFEILTVMAFKYYQEMKTDVVCLEVGIGGKMDATNVIEKNLLAIMTAVGLDHTNILGDTKEEIAIQKCGIIKRDCPVLIGPTVPVNIVEAFSKRLNSELFTIDSSESFKTFWELNEAIVHKAIFILNKKHGLNLKVDQTAIEKNLPGRRESVPDHLIAKLLPETNRPKFLITDVGHNEMAINHLLQSIKATSPTTDLIVVYGTSGLKDSLSTLSTIKNQASSIYLVQGQNHRAKPIESLEQDAKSLGIEYKCISNGLISDSLAHLVKTENLKEKGVVICGSFFIMEEARDFLGYQDEKDFFFLNEYNSM